MAVDTQHIEYADNIESWQQVRDCVIGSKAIKARKGGGGLSSLSGMEGTAYLPAPNSSDTSSRNKERYRAYLQRASFVNFTSQTKEGLTGLVFRKKTESETIQSLKYLLENTNGDGLSLDQMIKVATGEVLEVGRYGLLTDYPQAESGLTESQVSALNLQASIQSYSTESILNWKSINIGGVSVLSMVVLLEKVESEIDEFESELVDNYRVLLLKKIDDKYTYVQNVYDENKELITWKDGEDYTGDAIPRKNDGSTWDTIPFTFVGSLNNDSRVDKAPLLDISDVNIAHYRNSADYEESSFMVGQPMAWFSGLTQSWVDANMGGGVGLGSRSVALLPENGGAGIMQADSNQMPLEGMKLKELQLLKISARIIEDSSGQEAENTVRLRFIGQNSKLGSIIQNVESAFVQCFKWAQEFQGGTGETTININREFYPRTIDAQSVMAQVTLLDRGVIAKKDVRKVLRDSDLIAVDRTDEDIDSEAEAVSPLI